MKNIKNVPKRFISVHNHSGFSTYDGLGYPQEHIDFVLENGMNAWALTEHGHMNSFGHAFLHAEKLIKQGVDFKFIPGCEMYLHPDLDVWHIDHATNAAAKKGDKDALRKLRDDRSRIVTPLTAIYDANEDIENFVVREEDEVGLTVENEDESKANKFNDPVKRRHHLVVLPKTSIGLQRLFALVSRGYREGFYRFPRIDFKMLKEAAKGGHLAISSACIAGAPGFEVFKLAQGTEFNELSHKLLDDKSLLDKAVLGVGNVYQAMVDAVGEENAFLELQFNKLGAQHLVNRAIMTFADESGINDKLIVTADSHYSRPEHWRERELYKKLGWLNYKDFDPDKLPKSIDDLKCELYPKNATQIWDTYKTTTQGMDFYDDEVVCAAVERSYDVAHELIGDIQPDREMKLPSYVVPAGTTDEKELLKLCKEGLIARGLEKNPEYVERLKYELRTIYGKKFSRYFLTMAAITTLARTKMLIGPGRGSAASSLVAYVLKITDIDPIEHGLMFERFMSPHRKEPPDIDTDVGDRDQLINLMKSKWGDENIIPISNYNTFKLKSLIKDVSRFYGVPFDEVNKAMGPVESDVRRAVFKQGMDKNMFVLLYEDAMKHSKSFRDFLAKYPEVAGPIQVLFKQNKALGRHAGGCIVAEDVANRMPLIKARGELQTPWAEGMNYKHLETFGWIKFDLLGLETLRIVERAIGLILERHENIENPSFEQISAWFDKNMNPKVLDMNDQHVYKHVYEEGRFAGIFQLAGRGAQNLFKRAKPKSIIDIATLTSIYRPGPLTAGVDKLYINAKNNPDDIDYGHPLIEQVLKPTFNCIIFQEQIMKLCSVVAGFPASETDQVRRTIMKRKASEAAESLALAHSIKGRFVEGSVANGVPEKLADELYEKILYFCGYGFNACLYFSEELYTYNKLDEKQLKKISDVKAGDVVRSRDEKTGNDVYVEVAKKHNTGVKVVYEFELENGEKFKCTLDHKFRVTDGRMCPMSQVLEEELDIVTSASSKVKSYKQIGSHQTFDLEVDHPDHQFYLANGALTSNSHAVAYAVDSYHCAWLLTYYEEEWLCAYLEAMSGNDKKRAKAFGQARELGYRVVPIDINHASKKWTILEGKKLMPSLLTCKGIGESAADEIIENRPYKTLDDLLWDDDGKWRHSKFNKRALEALISISAFESMELVGEGKTFENYKQMHEVLITNNNDIKKWTKKDPDRGRHNFREILLRTGDTPPWTKKEMITLNVKYLSSFNAGSVVTGDLQNKLNELKVKCIDDFSRTGLYWFLVTDIKTKLTKNKQPYLLLTGAGLDGKTQRIFCWNWDGFTKMAPYTVCVAELKQNDFGMQTSMKKIKILSV